MSEYWKSTPKYWCKYCKTFVRDTTIEKSKHESTPRHKSNLDRSLRDLHRQRDISEREAQRAQREVDRLNGVLAGNASTSTNSKSTAPSASTSFAHTPTKQATVEDRKRQAAQLAALGVAVPDEFRTSLAIPGEWGVIERRVIGRQDDGDIKKEIKGDPDNGDNGLAQDKKRKFEDKRDVEMEEEEEPTVRKGWGRTFKSFQGKSVTDDNLDDILGGKILLKKKEESMNPNSEDESISKLEEDNQTESTEPLVKIEDENPHIEPKSTDAPIVFKKRKKKN